MAATKEEINASLPAAVVTRIVKEALPEGCNVAKDAKLALSKAASVFVLYLTSQANNIAMERNKKTISNRDVLEALQITEFGRFEEPLTDALERFRQVKEIKKAKKNEDKNESEVIEIEDSSENEVVNETNEEENDEVEVEEVDMEDEDETT